MANFKIGVNAKTFGDVLGGLLRVVSNKNAMAILDNFKIDVSDGVMAIQASDAEQSANALLSLDMAEGNGAICVNAKRLTDIVKKLDGNITMLVDGLSVNIITESGKYELMGMNGDEFPIDQVEESEMTTVKLSTEIFLKGLGDVAYASGTDAIWAQMMGVRIETHEGELVFVATDSRKLVVSRFKIDGVADGIGVTISSKTVSLIQTLLGKESDIEISLGEGKAVFRNNNVKITSSLIKGAFPDYNRVIPSDCHIKASVERTELAKAIGRISSFGDKSNLVVLKFDSDGLRIEAKDMSMATSARERVRCETNNDIAIGFNSEFLLQILNNLECDTVEIEMTEASRPALLSYEGANVKALIMPMNILE